MRPSVVVSYQGPGVRADISHLTSVFASSFIFFSSFFFFFTFSVCFLYSFSPSFFQSSIIIAGSFRVSLFIDLGWVRTRFGETLGNQFYRLQTKLRKSNVFTSVCQEFCQQGEGVHPPGQTPPADTPRQIASPSDTPLGRHPLRQTPSPSQLTTPPPNQAATAPDSTVLECILVLSRLFNSNQHSSVDRASGYSHTHDRSQLKRSAGVTPEVKLREHVTRTPLPSVKTSPKVQNSGSRKRLICSPKIKKATLQSFSLFFYSFFFQTTTTAPPSVIP